MACRVLTNVIPMLLALSVAGASAQAPSAAPSSAPATKLSFNPKTFASKDDNAPTYIESDSLTLNTEKRVFEYIGHVVVRHGDITLVAERMEGHYSEKNEIETIAAFRNVVVTKPPALKASGQRAFYDARDATVLLSENPAIEQEGSTLNADQIKVYLNENRSEAIGQVRVRVVKKDAGDAAASPSPSPSASPSPTTSPLAARPKPPPVTAKTNTKRPSAPAPKTRPVKRAAKRSH